MIAKYFYFFSLEFRENATKRSFILKRMYYIPPLETKEIYSFS